MTARARLYLCAALTLAGISACSTGAHASAGPVQTAPCKAGETGAQCQARLGAGWEVIYDPRTGVTRGERIPADAKADVVVNVNTATAAQLALLPGVGPKLAEAIIAARPIADSAALDGVKSIGPKKLEQLAPFVVFDGETTATAKIKLPKPAKVAAPVVPPAHDPSRRCPPNARC